MGLIFEDLEVIWAPEGQFGGLRGQKREPGSPQSAPTEVFEGPRRVKKASKSAASSPTEIFEGQMLEYQMSSKRSGAPGAGPKRSNDYKNNEKG